MVSNPVLFRAFHSSLASNEPNSSELDNLVDSFKGRHCTSSKSNVPRRLDIWLGRIDSHKAAAVPPYDDIAEMAHRWNRDACTYLDDDGPAHPGQPLLQLSFLFFVSCALPVGVYEHQDVGSSQVPAEMAARQFAQPSAGFRVNAGAQRSGGPSVVGARLEALQLVDRAVNLADAILGKPCLLKLPIDVRGQHIRAKRQLLCPSLQDRKSGVRLGSSFNPSRCP